MNKDSNKYLKENIRIVGCFILGAVIMAALIFHFDSIFGFSDERYIVSFWRDFLYNSPKEYTISALVHSRDVSSVLFFLTIELFRESFRTFSIRNCIAVDCKESSNE